ncbi:MAG TPA: ZIP family metal transporter [Usitatibacteraceae bacterium]|nr:ZIP family metal transporter [Usitatibacteraceae bacterium]
MPVLAWILAACLAGGLLSVLLAAVVAFRVQARLVPILVSYAVGALLGAVFLDMLPHLFEQSADVGATAALILFGILGFFVLEKLLLWRHDHGDAGETAASGPALTAHGHAHGHAHGADGGRSGWMIIVGDSFHNFTDGVIIASAFLADVKLGVVTSAAIVAHEVPQEVGDFLVLLNSGFSKARALALNAFSSLAAVLGALLGYFALSSAQQWVPRILAISAAGMLYVAVADLIPGLQRRTRFAESVAQVAFIALGILTLWVVHLALGQGH